MSTDYIEKFEKALLSIDKVAAQKIIMEIQRSEGTMYCVENFIVPTMDKMGTGWENGSVALSQLYMSGRICEELIDNIFPAINLAQRHQPKMAITVLNDYHFLGKRIVYTILRASGFELQDYGAVRDIETLVTQIKNDDIKILLVSVLMLNSALQVKTLIEMLKNAQLKTKVIVGGAPFRFDTKLWQEIGADAMGKTASDAIDIVSKMMEKIT